MILLGFSSQAADYEAEFKRVSKSRISKLRFAKTVKVFIRKRYENINEIIKRDNAVHEYLEAEVRGLFQSPDWSLLYDDVVVARGTSAKRALRIKIPLESADSKIELIAIGPKGEVSKADYRLKFPQYESAIVEIEDRVVRRHFFAPSLGFSLLSYQETAFPDLLIYGWAAKLHYRYHLIPSSLDLALNFYLHGLPISTVGATDTTLRIFGFNWRFGVNLPFVRYPLKLDLLFGWYYITSFSSGQSFGFRDVNGPQIFPVLNWALSARNTLLFYFKFSPLLEGVTLLSLDNREWAAGFGFTHRLRSGNPLGIQLDVSNLKLTPSQITHQLNSYTLFVSYGL